MPRRFKLIALALLCALLSAPAALAAGDDVPAWLRQAAAAQAPAYDKKVPAVVLLDEQTVTVSPDGRMRTLYTYAVRILTREGREEAYARIPYTTNSDKVKELKAWLLYPDGGVKKFGKDETADMSFVDNDVYNDLRARFIFAGDYADPGAVFGFQAVTEERSPFSQLSWAFQSDLPVLVSRYTLTLPPGWRSTSVTFNHAKVEPTVSGTTYTWELRNLPPIEDEPSGPSVANLVPRLAVNYGPEGAASTPGSGRVFNSWTDVSRWMSELHDPRIEPDDRIAVKVRELTAGARTELEKIQAVARYAQNIQYISVQVGIGGWQPHAATEIFSKSYGDCKDKVTLMRSMLRALRMQSYPVAVYAGDPTYVREEWPAAGQFNHVIVAVKVSDETQAPTVMQHPTLGRLLLFDPTDPHVPVGDLPQHEQGSFALIGAGDAGSLIRVPVTPPEANGSERLAEVELTPDGQIKAVFKERSVGDAAAYERRLFRSNARPDYNKIIERWIGRGAPGAQVTRVEPADATHEGRFALDVEFTAPNYAQVMQGRLMVFKPALISHHERLYLTEEKRRHPVVLQPAAYKETVRVKLPAGFDVDEVPEPTKLDTPFGSYAATYEVKDGHLLFTRSFKQQSVTLPADQYKAVRDFYARIRAAEQSPVVLAKK